MLLDEVEDGLVRRPSSVRPSEQSRKTSPVSAAIVNVSTSTSGSVPSARVITERCGWRLRLLGRELAAPHQLGDERVVLGQLLQLAVADQVRARVADVPERDLRRSRRARRSSSCPCRRRSGRCSSGRRRAGSPPGSRRRSAALPPSSAPLSFSAAAASREATSPACAPPIPSATAKSGGSTTYESSLLPALAAGIGRRHRRDAPRASRVSYLSSVSPTRTTSPCASRRGRSSRVAVHERAVRRAEVLRPRRRPAAARSARGAPTRTRPSRSGCRSGCRGRS